MLLNHQTEMGRRMLIPSPKDQNCKMAMTKVTDRKHHIYIKARVIFKASLRQLISAQEQGTERTPL